MKAISLSVTKGLLVVLTVILFSCEQHEKWQKAGSHPDSYLMETDKTVKKEGKDVFTIKSVDEEIEGFGTLMQFDSLVDKYLGERVRMSGYIKTKDVIEWAGLWFRVDQANYDVPLAFDNMHDGKEDRSVKGTTDWKEYEIVLDVDYEATNLSYGVILAGTGQIWFSDIKFEVVDYSVLTTGVDIQEEEMVDLESLIKGGNKLDGYFMGLDPDVKRDGEDVFTIKSIDKEIEGFGTMMQFDSLVDKYLGERVRMSGYIKTKDVIEWAGLWFRVDQANYDEPLAFDNMHDGKEDRSVKGTTDWKEYEIVLDVPSEATDLAYGILLVGIGQIWFNDIKFEIIDNSVPTTDLE